MTVLASHCAERRRLTLGLHSLGGHLHTERRRHRDDRFAERLASRCLVELHRERAVDLHVVEGNGLQVAQRRVARTEVVERESEACPLQRTQNVWSRRVAVEPLALRHLQHHLLG